MKYVYGIVMTIAMFMALPVAFSVTPTLSSLGITSDGAVIGNLAGATLITNGIQGTMHTLNVTNVIVNSPPLPLGAYGFELQANSIQKASLLNYFTSKAGWLPAYTTQITSEINGAYPFFYLTSDGNGHYRLADGFQYGLGNPVYQKLVIDDDYPVGTYTYSGTIGTQPETVSLTVSRYVAPTRNTTINTTNQTLGTPYQGSPGGFCPQYPICNYGGTPFYGSCTAYNVETNTCLSQSGMPNPILSEVLTNSTSTSTNTVAPTTSTSGIYLGGQYMNATQALKYSQTYGLTAQEFALWGKQIESTLQSS